MNIMKIGNAAAAVGFAVKQMPNFFAGISRGSSSVGRQSWSHPLQSIIVSTSCLHLVVTTQEVTMAEDLLPRSGKLFQFCDARVTSKCESLVFINGGVINCVPTEQSAEENDVTISGALHPLFSKIKKFFPVN